MRTPSVKKNLVERYWNDETRKIPVMLLGPPGVGKSEGVLEASEEIAEEMDRELVIYSDQKGREILNSDKDDFFVLNSVPLVSHEPVDFTGVPRTDGNGFVEFKPLLWTRVMEQYPGVLFLDDALDVQRPDLMSSMYKLSLERRAGYRKFDSRIQVVCASNAPSQSSLSQKMPAPLANRFMILNVNKPTVNEWAKWMDETYGDGWNRKTLAFLKKIKNEGKDWLLDMPEDTEVLENFPTPRSWSKAGLELNGSDNIHRERLQGLLGPDAGRKFHSFLEIDVDVDQLLKEPELWEEQTLDAKYMLCMELASWFDEADDLEEGFDLLDRISEDSRQFVVLVFLSMTDSMARTELIDKSRVSNKKYSQLLMESQADRQKISTA